MTRVALIDQPRAAPHAKVAGLAKELEAAGHDAHIVQSPNGVVALGRNAAEWVLDRRGFSPGLSDLPFVAAALKGSDAEVVHAFHPSGGSAAARWAKSTGRPLVFTFPGIASRERLAARRRDVDLLNQTLAAADAVVASDHRAADALRRWVGVEPVVIFPTDGLSHAHLYRSLLT